MGQFESPLDRASRVVEELLGTKDNPTQGQDSLSEGINLANNQFRALRNISGFDLCSIGSEEDPCSKCKIFGGRVCDLVKAEHERALRAAVDNL